jgi:hypothetical protein
MFHQRPQKIPVGQLVLLQHAIRLLGRSRTRQPGSLAETPQEGVRALRSHDVSVILRGALSEHLRGRLRGKVKFGWQTARTDLVDPGGQRLLEVTVHCGPEFVMPHHGRNSMAAQQFAA